MTTMRRSAFEQGISEPRYEIRHQWAGNGRGKVTAVVMQDGGGHLPVAELGYRTAKGRGEVTVGEPQVHPAHAGRGLEEQMRAKLLAEYPQAR
jgi:predicted GNAT family acetyltransferase